MRCDLRFIRHYVLPLKRNGRFDALCYCFNTLQTGRRVSTRYLHMNLSHSVDDQKHLNRTAENSRQNCLFSAAKGGEQEPSWQHYIGEQWRWNSEESEDAVFSQIRSAYDDDALLDQSYSKKSAGHTPVLANATVVEVSNVSPTIRKLLLKIDDPSGQFSFKAGQWVDFFIPGVKIFTGYSMLSSPDCLCRHGTLELAVKNSDYPPTAWVHTKCTVGSHVKVRVGGDFFYDPELSSQSDLLLIAGGVGINPILSIMRHVQDINNEAETVSTKVHLLYSAGSENELVFKDVVESLCSGFPSIFQRHYFITQQKSQLSQTVTGRRIAEEDIAAVLATVEAENVHSYICGPSSMIDSMEQFLLTHGLKNEQIHYEKWW